MKRRPFPLFFCIPCLSIVLGSLSTVAVRAAEPPSIQAPEMIDVFTAGSDGYFSFRIPAIVVTNKRTLLAFCEGRKTSRSDHGDIDLVLRRSTDGGKTWSGLILVHEEGGQEKITIGNPSPVVDRDTGTVWLPLTRDNDDVLVTSSSDDGLTWAEPRKITTDVKRSDWDWYATGPGNAIQLTRGPHAGRLVIPCDHRVVGGASKNDWQFAGRSHVIYSDDHGQNWKLGGVTGWGMNECAVAELIDGALLLNMRSYRKHSRRAVAQSKDGGLTWSEPVDDAALVEPVCQGSLIRYTWADKNGRSRLLFCNPADEKTRRQLTVRVSYDEGQTWPAAKVLYPGSAAYSNLAALPDLQIGVLFERDEYKQITFAKFDLSWLTDGEDRVAK